MFEIGLGSGAGGIQYWVRRPHEMLMGLERQNCFRQQLSANATSRQAGDGSGT